MVWSSVSAEGVKVLLGEAYMPDIETIRAIAEKYVGPCPAMKRPDYDDRESSIVWLLSSLAKRDAWNKTDHRYDKSVFELSTWMLGESPTPDGKLQIWFEDSRTRNPTRHKDYRLFVHPYSEHQGDRTFRCPPCFYGYSLLRMKHGPHAHTHLDLVSKPVLRQLCEDFQRGHEAFLTAMQRLSHPIKSSGGWPTTLNA